jgi:hypothetical protein
MDPSKRYQLGGKPTIQHLLRRQIRRVTANLIPNWLGYHDERLTQARNTPSSSALYRLPAELVFLVCEFLPSDGVLALKITSSRFNSLIAYPRIERDSRWKVHDYLFWESFLRGCKMEREGNLHASHLMCRGCQVSHEKRWFSLSEQRKRVGERFCVGCEGRVIPCDHFQFTYCDFIRLMRKNKWQAPDCISYIDECHPCSAQNRRAGIRHPSEVALLPRIQEFILSRQYRLLTVPKVSIIAFEDIWNAATKISEAICPHLRINDPASFGQKHLKHVKDYELYWQYHLLPLAGPTHYQCRSEGCDTRYFVAQTLQVPKEDVFDIVLTVRRSLGNCKSALEPKWLAQLAPSQVSNKSCNYDVAPGTRIYGLDLTSPWGWLYLVKRGLPLYIFLIFIMSLLGLIWKLGGPPAVA